MYRTLLCFALFQFMPAIRGAGDASLDRATLRGLKAMTVVLDKLDPQLEQEGLSTGRLQSQLEDRLRRAGINVDKNAVEFLGLRISAARVKKGPYSLYLTVGLYQPVTLSRDKNIKTATQTWEAGTLLIVPPKLVEQSSADAVDRLADQFAAAFRSVNAEH